MYQPSNTLLAFTRIATDDGGRFHCLGELVDVEPTDEQVLEVLRVRFGLPPP